MPHKYILAVDQGTTSSRAIVFDHAGQSASIARKEFTQSYPQPGWVEHDPIEIWSTQSAVIAEAIARADLTPSDIAAVGIANQRETTVVWDRNTGKPIHPAIVWQDRRTADQCRQMKAAGLEEVFRKKTGLLLDPYFSGTKLRWILDNVTGARTRAENGELLFGTVDTWLVWKLTAGKVHVTDPTNASRTLLYNIHALEWDSELLSHLDIPLAMLPEVKPSSHVSGYVNPSLLPGQIPIAGIAGDQHAALFGQACFAPGMAKNTYGTGCFLLMNTGETPAVSKNNLLSTIAWQIGDTTEYALEGSVFIGGAVVQWLRDELQIVRSAEECSELAATVPDSAGVFLVPAFSGLGAPHWDPYARGAAFGLTRGTNRAHLCRAALEAIAFQSGDLIHAMEKDAGIPLKELRVDGGACRSEPLMQFQADLLQSPVIRPDCIETTALGAAYLAGLAVGYWKSKDEIAANWKESKRFKPARPVEEMDKLQTAWQEAVTRSKEWIPGNAGGPPASCS